MSVRSVLIPAVIIVLGAAGYVGYQRTNSCVVGVSGTDATLTVRGWRASSLCDGLVASTTRSYYRRDEAAVGNVLCEYDDEGKHYTVRDQGVVMLVGRAVCAELARDPGAVRRAAGG